MYCPKNKGLGAVPNPSELVSVMEPDLLQTDPSRVLMRQVFGAIAQYKKAMIVAKLRGVRYRTKLKEGRCEGRKSSMKANRSP
jgi:hypothetical protein